ncbi:MAG: DUF6519 domain-containing protein [Dehalococcoidia bacterium]
MYGDFSRLSFAQARHYSAVLLQQGRVSLDADTNENTAILQHYLRTLARDLIGPHGGAGNQGDPAGFSITIKKDSSPLDLEVSAGRYYVEGLLIENDDINRQGTRGVTYFTQPDPSFAATTG